jgi:hypothetical protein
MMMTFMKLEIVEILMVGQFLEIVYRGSSW